jgi:hypothetical protein
MQRNTFINNLSTGHGPAVYDRYHAGAVEGSNTGCGNTIISDANSLLNGNLQCNGVYTVVGPEQLRRCEAFQFDCVAPTNSPTAAPILPSSSQPSGGPSLAPSTSREQSESASFAPSGVPLPETMTSSAPSGSASFQHSGVPSARPTTSSKPSGSTNLHSSAVPSIQPTPYSGELGAELSISPSRRPSGIPALVNTEKASIAPSSTPSEWSSLLPHDYPSMIPSDTPSLIPSDAPSMTPSVTLTGSG